MMDMEGLRSCGVHAASQLPMIYMSWCLMKVGDLVKDNQPFASERIGLIVGRTNTALHNKSFKVLWRDGTIGKNVWDYDLKVINETR